MCTVTIVPEGGDVIVGCNRDERLDRPVALPPALRCVNHHRAAFPIDPADGGTWIGVNDLGLAVVLLNRNVDGDRPAARAFRRSRGLVGVHALGASSQASAVQRIVNLPFRAFDPFTAVVLDCHRLTIVTNDGWRFTTASRSLQDPLLLTSSSLGDALVAGPRSELFGSLLAAEPSAAAAQRRFHAHRWPDRPELSVDMRRADAATVSRTWVRLSPSNRFEMRYECTRSAARHEVQLCAN